MIWSNGEGGIIESSGESVTSVKPGRQLGKLQCQPSKFSLPNTP